MVSDTIIAALISVAGLATVSGIGYLIREVSGWKDDVKEWRNEMKREHAVVVSWLSRMTDALRDEGVEVEKPEEIESVIELDE